MATNHASGPDPALLELFRSELETHLPTLSDGLLLMEKGDVDEGRIEGMMRAAHSIKGAARIVGVDLAVRVAHAMEDCFTAAKNKEVVLGSASVDVLLAAVDALQQICSPVEGAEFSESMLPALLEGLAAVKAGKAVPKAKSAESGEGLVAAGTSGSDGAIRWAMPERVDATNVEEVRGGLLELLEDGPSRIEVDFGRVRELSVTGMILLVGFVREAALIAPAPEVRFEGVSGELGRLWQAIGLSGLQGAAHGEEAYGA